ncbi:unnamed protein product [Candidula unifasciata]|uniref:TGF-beta family profile domain-containing protein n=1 Tax=Candidula unifasciata TaxID=100452 RepID=A0A8S3Z7Y8_9EUPU|nr:unnamed protein product [Candidula unifasciata]
MTRGQTRSVDANSGSQADNVTHSSGHIGNINVTSESVADDGSSSPTELIRNHLGLESPEEKLTQSLGDVPKTNWTVSSLEPFSSSASLEEKLANYTLGASNTNITVLSQTKNMFNLSSEFNTTLETTNVSNSTSEQSQTNVTSNAQTENLLAEKQFASGPTNMSHSTVEIWEQQTDSQPHSQHGGKNESQQAVMVNETKGSFAFDQNTSCPDSSQNHNLEPEKSLNHSLNVQPKNLSSSPKTEESMKPQVEEDYDYGIDDSSSNHSSAEAREPVLEPGCPSCRMRAIDRHYRILQFKNQILSSLQITNIPNVTGVPIPKVPALTHLYEMDVDLMSDPPNGRRNQRKNDQEYDDDFVVKTERIFIGAKEAPMALHLNLTNTVYFPPAVHLFTSEIKSAYLWFYIRKHPDPPVSVSIELIVPQAKSEKTFGTKKLLSVKLARQKAHGWKRIDLTSTLSQWIKHPMTNFGLILRAEDKSGNNLIVLPHPPDVDKGYEPCLDTKVIESRHNSRRRRSESLMCVENSTDTRCCRHPLIVGFAEFGWDWIIAPTHVNADYCTGECRMTMQDNTPYSWVNQQVPGTNSCCTPTKLSPLPLMYFDENMHIVYQILQNMKVDKCGCA